jgi:hypothetical protein
MCWRAVRCWVGRGHRAILNLNLSTSMLDRVVGKTIYKNPVVKRERPRTSFRQPYLAGQSDNDDYLILMM